VNARLAQLEEHRICNPEIVGSIPAVGLKRGTFKEMAENLAMIANAGYNLADFLAPFSRRNLEREIKRDLDYGRE
jgi:hypothetical protein